MKLLPICLLLLFLSVRPSSAQQDLPVPAHSGFVRLSDDFTHVAGGLAIVMPPLPKQDSTSVGQGNRHGRLILEVVVILVLVAGYFYFFLYRKPRKK